jgi:hypothetical protein
VGCGGFRFVVVLFCHWLTPAHYVTPGIMPCAEKIKTGGEKAGLFGQLSAFLIIDAVLLNEVAP